MSLRGRPLLFKILIHLASIAEVVKAVSAAGTQLEGVIRTHHEIDGIPKMMRLDQTPLNYSLGANESLKVDSFRALQNYKNLSSYPVIDLHATLNQLPPANSRRRLLEYNPNWAPEDNPFHVNFTGYQESDVNVQQWMVDLLKGIYDLRMEEGAANPLCFNEILMKSAQAHIYDIVDQELMLSHIGTDKSTSGERITREGYVYESYGATITKTGCTDVACALVNRPLFFTKQSKFLHFGIAREENHYKGDPRWYWIFGESEENTCMGMDTQVLEWPAGTPTRPPEPPEPELPPVDPNDGGDMITDRMIGILSLMNAERQHAGVHNLGFNKKLMLAAQRHNQDMADNDFMGHTGSDGSSPASRATDEGYENFQFISENVAGPDMPSIRAAMYYWMSSTGNHAFNILDPNGYHVGMAFDEEKRLYTVVFGGYFNDDEKAISSVTCDSTTSYQTSDPDWESYACSLCLQRRPVSQFGVMGCGFGREWYFQANNDLESYVRRS